MTEQLLAEIEILKADNARVTAERNEAKTRAALYEAAAKDAFHHSQVLRAKVERLWEFAKWRCRTANRMHEEVMLHRARVAELEGALREAEIGLRRAWEFLGAVYDSEPTMDRRKARDRAGEAMVSARKAMEERWYDKEENHE